MATLFKPMDVQVDGDGVTLAGARLYFYRTGTSTPQDTFSHADLAPGHVNPNPVIADADGLWPPIYLGTTDYKAILRTAADVAIQTLDPVLVNPQAASLSDNFDAEFGSTQYSLLQRGASAWQAVTFKTIFDQKFGTVPGSVIVRGATDWLGVPGSFSNSLGANVDLDDIALYFDGPSVAVGTVGTFCAVGTVTCYAVVYGDVFDVKLWDGTTVMASTRAVFQASGGPMTDQTVSVSLAGVITSPAGAIRISVKCSNVGGKILFNASGNSRDSSLAALRVG